MSESILQTLTSILEHNNNPFGLIILAFSVILEYIFPPFPGDSITIFSAILVTRYHWNLALVFFSLMIGSGVGAMIAYFFGHKVYPLWRARYKDREKFKQADQTIEKTLSALRKYGEPLVAVNRFVPAFRALVFVAAGMAQLRPGRVLFFALVSAALWNGLILAVAVYLNASWDHIKVATAHYTQIVWIVVALLAVLGIAFWLWRRKK